MKLSTHPPGAVHPSLKSVLRPAATRLLRSRRWQAQARRFRLAAAIGLGFAAIGFAFPSLANIALYGAAFAVVWGIVWALISSRYRNLDYRAAAALVESEQPTLQQALLTAVQLSPADRSNFLGQRTIDAALDHPSLPYWSAAGKSSARRHAFANLASLLAAVAVVGLAYLSVERAASLPRPAFTNTGTDPSLAILPGNLSVERGASVLVTARFGGPIPGSASLEALFDSGETRLADMMPGLADPVFAFTLPQIPEGLRYRVVHPNGASDFFRIDVYDLPALLRADADLTFPEYTRLAPRRIEDTRRIAAIEGSNLDFRFRLNKPVAKAYLLASDGETIELAPTNDTASEFALVSTLSSSGRYRLHLVDHEDRRNAFPDEIILEAQPNQRPQFRVESPRGDQRPSALEELTLLGKATDDFALLDYGVAFAFGPEAPRFDSLKTDTESAPSFEASLAAPLRLEEHGLAPGDLVSWFLWADDHGPDGLPRRTHGDLLFAEIRPFDEAFREQDGGGQQGGQQGGNPGAELLDQQRRISIALFKLNNDSRPTTDLLPDLDTLEQAQAANQATLAELAPMLPDAESKQNAAAAATHMQAVIDELDTTDASVETAWSSSQAAYQSLLRLSSGDINVSRSSNSSGGGGGQSRNQRQLDELEFRQEENRYQTATKAQPPGSPQDQQDMQLVAKLNELSRRQDDLNQRLRETQAELANARDEEERERIRRELRRLEEQQRQMLAEMDEAIQQTGPSQRQREARQQLEQARENMRQAADQLSENEVSEALASGSRASEGIERSRDQARQRSASQFADALQQASAEAERLQESQEELTERLQSLIDDPAQRLDDSDRRNAVSEEMDELRQGLADLENDLRQIAEASETAEPALHRRLYDLMRQQRSDRLGERIEIASELARQGLLDQSQNAQSAVAEGLERLSESIAQASSSIQGSDSAARRFAQQELEQLRSELQSERGQPASPSETPGESGPGEDLASALRRSLSDISSSPTGPLTGSGFGDWVERLRTVESLLDTPEARQRLGEAREAAEGMRRDFARRGELPRWEMIEASIVDPMDEVNRWIRQELAREENPDALQSVDRDPVPQQYSEAVRRYYESLGQP